MLTIKHGPTFTGFLSSLGMFVAVGFIFISIFMFDLSSFSGAVVSLVCIFHVIFGINLFLAMRGVQIDKARNKIREYHSILGLKLGRWKYLSDYSRLILHFDRFTVTTSTPYTWARRSNKQTFDVTLVSEDDKHGIHLYECFTYDSGRARVDEISALLDMDVTDQCMIDLRKSKERRTRRRR